MHQKHPQPCEDCGATVIKRRRTDRHILCTDCAARRIERSNLDMAFGSGPAWEAWKAGMDRYNRKLVKRYTEQAS